jgi:hypothetical protein
VRTTLHVPDVVFEGYLYQILDYQPDRGGRGRRWSERYGILGRAWRMDRSVFADHALGQRLPKIPKETATKTLLRDWGMNSGEAEEGAKGFRQSYLCLILRVDRRQVGVLYMDCSETAVFSRASAGADDEFEAKPELEELPAIKNLAAATDKAMSDLRGKGTYLEF